MTDSDEDIHPAVQEYLEFVEQAHKDTVDNWEEKFERPEGLLTDKQRQFLSGVFEYTGENARQRRYGMRQRIRRRFINGILDLHYLHSLDEGSRERIIDELGESGLRSYTTNLLEFIYLQTGNQDSLNKIHETAVYNVLSLTPELRESSMRPGSVDVTTTVHYPPDPMEIAERAINSGLNSLRPEEIGYLVLSEQLEPEQLVELYETSRIGVDSEGVFLPPVPGEEDPLTPEQFDKLLQRPRPGEPLNEAEPAEGDDETEEE